MTELEKLKQQLNEISEKVKQLENPKFEVGKWYKTIKGHLKYFVTEESAYGFDSCRSWDGLCNGFKLNKGSFDWQPATDKEVEEALIKYFESKHGKPSNKWKAKGFWGDETMSIGDSGYYSSSNGRNFWFGYGGTCLMNNGKWAEIIKDEPIKVGGHPVEKHGGYVKIGCKEIDVHRIESLSLLMKHHNFKKVAFDGIEVDLETIEKILKM